MADDARIGYMPTRVWGCPTTAMWVYRLGAERAKRMLFTGDKIDGREAERLGLVLKAVPADALDDEVDALAHRMATVPQNQLMMQKLMVNQALDNMGLNTHADDRHRVRRHHPAFAARASTSSAAPRRRAGSTRSTSATRAPSTGPPTSRSRRTGSSKRRIQVGGESALSDRDGNFLRDHWRIERKVVGIPQHELERMLAGWKLDPRFGLTCAEMKMRLVLRDRFVRIERLIDVDQKMVVAAVCVLSPACVRPCCADQSGPKSAFDGRCRSTATRIEKSILVCGLALSAGGERQAGERYRENDPTASISWSSSSTLSFQG